MKKRTSKNRTKPEKIYGIIFLVIAAIAFLLGLPTLSAGGWIFLIIGLPCLLLGLRYLKKGKASKDADAPVAPLVDPPPAAPTPQKDAPVGVTYKVAGVSHYEANILSLASRSTEYTLSKRQLIEEGLTDERIWEYDFYPLKVEIVPEPENPLDPNALKVLVDGAHVGYIKSGSCSRMRHLLDTDRILRITAEIGGGRYKYVELVDYTESGKDIYEMEHGSVNFYVHLSVYEKPTDL